MPYVVHAVAIVVCGLAGAYAAWAAVDSLGWTGVGGAIATSFVAMVGATLMWAGGVALGKALRLLK